ncbi:hypothetical protein BC936DRAFT_137100 [Jimgerdemannia flammicorona]|uniref:Ysc84 actin-binding domain-containing protein n=1 Tax=Jimgerdemannia flammicorona TaxID=994334 RepID=A0A433CY19_9FUNG|nr:hypothetical protein BC936DRAFT_137100 [Jimgerdemannia flammicorona]
MFKNLKQGVSSAASKTAAAASAAGTRIQESAKNAEINSPLPTDLGEETKKAAKILSSFTQKTETEQGFDVIIPPAVIANAKGLAIFTVIKAGFITSLRAGNGLVIARLPDGKWSAPSCIATGGVGFGAQIGADITDFVIILNTDEAVRAFSKGGNLTLGGALSISAGPIGAGGEAAVSANSMAAIFSYSKSKGLFAGISVEGTGLLERSESNAKFYGKPVKAEELLTGAVPPPPEAKVLYDTIEAAITRE